METINKDPPTWKFEGVMTPYSALVVLQAQSGNATLCKLQLEEASLSQTDWDYSDVFLIWQDYFCLDLPPVLPMQMTWKLLKWILRTDTTLQSMA